MVRRDGYVGPEGEGIDASSIDMSKRDPMFEEAARLPRRQQQQIIEFVEPFIRERSKK